MKSVYITGYPNSGKTTLFNALTGSHAMVGNWSGVTVDVEHAPLSTAPSTAIIHDIPGLYSLMDQPSNQDEILAHQTLFQAKDALLIQVIDAGQLERQLFLTSELLDLHQPLIIVLNHMALAEQQGLSIDLNALEHNLSCPVMRFDPHDPQSLMALNERIGQSTPAPGSMTRFHPNIESRVLAHQNHPDTSRMHALIHVLQEDRSQHLDLEIADARYTFAHTLMQQCTHSKQREQEDLTTRLDRIVLHRTLGLPLFFLLIYGMFYVVMKVGGLLQTLFEQSSTAILIDYPHAWLTQHHAPSVLTHLITDGLGQGLTTTLTFIPVLGMMYIGLSLLEGSGYMARIAYLMDRLMRSLGLPGKAFVPLLIGFGCNVPAILATRTLDHPRDRILTSLMLPFMSCSARLTLFTALVSSFFPQQGHHIIFTLYVLGILLAITCGWLIQRTLLPSQPSPLILELPLYQRPELTRVLAIAYYRLKQFVMRASVWIISMCLLMSALNQITFHEQSCLSWLGRSLTPLFAPMGITQDNWPATVGLLTGLLAKEVVMGTLNTLYQHQTLQQAFHSSASLYAYLTFLLLYLPCISTMTAIKQETSARWMWISMFGSLLIAYGTATLTYWIFSRTWNMPVSLGTLCMLALFAFMCIKIAKHLKASPPPTPCAKEESHAL